MDFTQIYLITNCFGDPNKVYIGKEKLSKNKRRNRKADHKLVFGDNIIFTFIDEINSLKHENWKPIECFWIEQFRQWGFKIMNKNKGGGGPSFQSEETKSKISKANKGKKQSKETCEKKSIIATGKLRHESFSKSQSIRLKGVPKPNSWESILQYDKQGNFIKEWSSLSHASKELNIGIQNICACLKGRVKSMGGFQWKYKTENYLLKIEPFKIKQDRKFKNCNKPIIQCDLEGNFIREWTSQTEASIQLKINNSDINACCKGRQSYVGKFKFKYKEYE